MFSTLATDLEEHGGAIVIVEQNIIKALEIADRALVVVDGHIVHSGGARELTTDKVAELFFRMPGLTTHE
jgi:ABC-type branched-subunit amino acid transport system ATPase component